MHRYSKFQPKRFGLALFQLQNTANITNLNKKKKFKQNKITYQYPSRKSKTIKKSKTVLPKMLKLYSRILDT